MRDLGGRFGADLRLFFSARQRRKILERYNRRGDSVDTGAAMKREPNYDA